MVKGFDWLGRKWHAVVQALRFNSRLRKEIAWAAVAMVILATVAIIPQTWFTLAYWQAGEAATRSEIVRNLGLVALTLAGGGFAAWRSWIAHRHAVVAEQGHITDRFSTAAEQLGKPELPVRLGGIYALWRLAADAPTRDALAVIDILCAFVRNPPFPDAERPAVNQEGDDGIRVRADVEAIVKLLTNPAEREKLEIDEPINLDLRSADLRGLLLPHANFSHADLSDADLSGTHLPRANFDFATLIQADFTNAFLLYARFNPVTAYQTNLEDANLDGADFTNSEFIGSRFCGASLISAKFMNCNLYDTDFSLAKLRSVDFSRADLVGADFARSDLHHIIRDGARNAESLEHRLSEIAGH